MMYLVVGICLIGFLKSSIFGFVEFFNYGKSLVPPYFFLPKPRRN